MDDSGGVSHWGDPHGARLVPMQVWVRLRVRSGDGDRVRLRARLRVRLYRVQSRVEVSVRVLRSMFPIVSRVLPHRWAACMLCLCHPSSTSQ